jgi:hypothetical protein
VLERERSEVKSATHFSLAFRISHRAKILSKIPAMRKKWVY